MKMFIIYICTMLLMPFASVAQENNIWDHIQRQNEENQLRREREMQQWQQWRQDFDQQEQQKRDRWMQQQQGR